MHPARYWVRYGHIFTLTQIYALQVILGLALMGGVVLHDLGSPEDEVTSVPLLWDKTHGQEEKDKEWYTPTHNTHTY